MNEPVRTRGLVKRLVFAYLLPPIGYASGPGRPATGLPTADAALRATLPDRLVPDALGGMASSVDLGQPAPGVTGVVTGTHATVTLLYYAALFAAGSVLLVRSRDLP